MTEATARKGSSLKAWLTGVTLVLLAVVIIVAWPEIVAAWNLMGQVNIWILALLIPIQLMSYFATGEVIFSYLRSKGDGRELSAWSLTRIFMELNFVNHVVPSGGAAGFSYLSWVLTDYKVSVARSTMAQIVRYALTALSFVLLVVTSVVVLALDHQTNRSMLVSAAIMVVGIVALIIFAIWLMKSRRRLDHFSNWLEAAINKVAGWVTRGRVPKLIKRHVLVDFFDGIYDDFIEIRKDRRLLVKPFIWSVIANSADVVMLWVAFWALGYAINPALLVVGFGLAVVTSAFVTTPGGAGAYEAVLAGFLASAGIKPDVAIAGVLLARVVLITMAVVTGYVFYQMRILQLGKKPPTQEGRELP